ncbi:MAG: riboflavin synthase [Firmicutes bacterium HGW-Firmicutes-1]|jgi:riboflavin synthase|nr:MAG: riboflavin synthase [Firmicutes bacterium HGW-Firmicutes-1]
MFTGLIEEVGTIKDISKGTKSAILTIKASEVLKEARVGDSICTNGVCLTVTKLSNDTFSVDVMPETMRMSNLGNLSNGSKVNLERALKVSDRMGGHIVSGHIDDTGIITNIEDEDNATWITIKPPKELMKYIINKGSIAIDGTSLTVANVDEVSFKVSIIPLTKDKTILLTKKVGHTVNLECDVVGKYIEKLLSFTNDKKESNITMDFLRQNGF